jgi:hypothetical protein|tara:strand:- start:1333 stop:1791 length:459 start_codon:yes stop_codon:yes gene_type:complete
MQKLNLPSFQFKLKSSENKQLIFDIIRKKYVVLTPEEWVRQNLIHFLIKEKNYPISLISCEKQLLVNKLKKRFDLLIYGPNGTPILIIECKSPKVKISQDTFDQIARYNMELKSEFLVVSNGIIHYSCKVNHEDQSYIFLEEIPKYEDIYRN